MSTRRIQLAAFGIVLLTIATRLPALQHPQAIDDEAAYSMVANEIVDGGQPYIAAVDRKPPLLFWTYAAVFKIAGKYNWLALHTVALLWTLGTMGGRYTVGRRLFNRETGLIAALLYSVFQPWATANNLAFNGELLMNLPIVWAWSIAFGRGFPRLRPELFGAGALLCAAFLLKQPGAIAALPLGIYLLLPSYRTSRGITKTGSLIHAAILTAGFFGALGLVTIVLARQGILRDAFYWTIANHDIPHVFWDAGILHTLAFIATCLPLILGAGMAFRDQDRLWGKRHAERLALLGLLIASIIGAAAGARFYPHYYVQLIPPLALLAAPYYARIWMGCSAPRFWFFRPGVVMGWFAITIVAFSISHWTFLAKHREPSETARYLGGHSAPDDRIFVWGRSAASFYLGAQRPPACRYILTYPLTGLIFGGDLPGIDTRDRIVPGAWNNLEEDFRKHPPVLIAELISGSNKQYPARDFPVLAKLLEHQYELVARTDEGLVYRKR